MFNIPDIVIVNEHGLKAVTVGDTIPAGSVIIGGAYVMAQLASSKYNHDYKPKEHCMHDSFKPNQVVSVACPCSKCAAR